MRLPTLLTAQPASQLTNLLDDLRNTRRIHALWLRGVPVAGAGEQAARP